MTFMIYYYIQNNYPIPVDPFGFGSEISNKKKWKRIENWTSFPLKLNYNPLSWLVISANYYWTMTSVTP